MRSTSSVHDNIIVSGLRKKLDVARILIDDIRATVTQESRRKALIEAVGAFEKKAPKEEQSVASFGISDYKFYIGLILLLFIYTRLQWKYHYLLMK